MRDLIITLIVVGSLPVTLLRPYVGIYMWAWLSYMNPHRLAYGFAYNMPFALMVAAAVFGGFVFYKERKGFPINSLSIIWLVFVFWLCASTLLAIDPAMSTTGLIRSLKIQIMTIMTIVLIKQRQHLDIFVWVLAGSLAFFGVKGGAFAVLSGGEHRVWGPTDSFIEGNNELALALVMTVPLMKYLMDRLDRRIFKLVMLGCIGLTCMSILSSYSRGAFLAISSMGLVLWYRSNSKLISAAIFAVIAVVGLNFMPDKWFDRMDTIETYEEDASAMGRINAWYFAINLTKERPISGGGFDSFNPHNFQTYAPIPDDFHDAHSIYFQILGEQGYVGLILFLSIWALCLVYANRIRKKTKEHEDLKWAFDLSSMVQVSLIGYGVGGAFLGLGYFDFPYHLMAITLITQVIVERELEKKEDKPVNRFRQQYG